MKLQTLILIALLATLGQATEQSHEGHNHAKGEHGKAKAPKGIYYGKILSIDNAGAYKYLKINEDGKELWVAIANAPVKVGDKIGYDKMTVMKDFKSKSLKKTFKEVIFASDVYLPEKNKGIKDLQDMLGLSTANKNTPKKVEKKTVTEKPAKPFVKKEFYTVEEVFMWKNELKDSTIKVKGKVQKISRQIMKVDWVHIGDGTGDSTKKNNDIVFTTKTMTFKSGSEVIASGKLILDKDFGYGYFYDVIVQDSEFKAQ